MEATPRITFIIPVFNGLELTRECLRTLSETALGRDREIIIVDDGSSDGTREFLTTIDRPDTRIILNEKNLGYAGANNAAGRIARGEFLCLINNDLVFEPGWLEPMLDAFAQDPEVGIVGNIQTAFATGALDHAGIFIALDGKPHHLRKAGLTRRWCTTTSVAAVTGACLMIRRSDFLELGGFDEQFVNGAEDVDLCFQMTARNRRIVVANRSRIRHHVGASRLPGIQDEENCRRLFAKWPDHLARLGAQKWPAHHLDSVFHRRVRFRPGLFLTALAQAMGLRSEPGKESLALVRQKMGVTEDHWQVQLGGGVGRDKPSLLREFQYEGFHSSEVEGATWIKENARVTLPAGIPVGSMYVRGLVLPAPTGVKQARGRLGIRLIMDDTSIATLRSIPTGPFIAEVEREFLDEDSSSVLEIQLIGTGWSNALAYFGRVTATWPLPARLHETLQGFRPQPLNQRLQITRIGVNGEDVLDFARPNSPFVYDFAQRHTQLGINLVGWFAGELGVGESVRCAAKAIDAAKIPHALVDCRLNCLAAQGDTTYRSRIQGDNPYPINIFHIDAPQSADIDHHHGPDFRSNRYNIAYWAWELPEFPDGWIRYFKFFDEVWTPSRFTSEAIGRKSPLPVLTMPHVIDFAKPAGGSRHRMGLPEDRFLFLMMYDLNSYQERKNPRAVIEAYTRAFNSGAEDVGLVVKVHGLKGNEAAFAELTEAVAPLSGVHLIAETLARASVYDLIAACDCFVSLHRSEGFGLGVAEAMFLEKPVISTDWSATAEFVNPGNGCPVNFRLIELERSIGPYGKGQIWADPDIDHAAGFMRQVAANPILCRELGYNARQTILRLFAPQVIGGLYEQRLRAITLW
ncbi:MAG: glycosyltransferase [Opitutaceae bacterium]